MRSVTKRRWSAGSLVSHAVVGAPDVIVPTLSELAEQVHHCARGAGAPRHGRRPRLRQRAWRDAHRARARRCGAAAVMIEDTLLPRAYGPSCAPTLLPHDEALDKVRAAVAARGDAARAYLGAR